MLHRILTTLATLLWVTPAWSTDGGTPLPRGVLTQGDVRLLDGLLVQRVVSLRRRMPKGQFIVPGGQKPIEAVGWRAAPGRVVTAAMFVRDWPTGPDDVIEAQVDGAWRPAGVGVLEKALGLVVLDVPGLSAPAGAKAPTAAAVFTGRPLYYYSPSGARFVKVGPAAKDQHAYYIWLEGASLPLGTPLFDARGDVLTLVGVTSPAPGRSLVLPARALRALFERGADWIP